MTVSTRRPSRLPILFSLVASVGLLILAMFLFGSGEQLSIEWGRYLIQEQLREEIRSLEQRQDRASRARVNQLRQRIFGSQSRPSESRDSIVGYQVGSGVALVAALGCIVIGLWSWRRYSRLAMSHDEMQPNPNGRCHRCRRFLSWWNRPYQGKLVCCATCQHLDLAFPLLGEPRREELARYLRTQELLNQHKTDHEVVAKLAVGGIDREQAIALVAHVHAEHQRQKEAGYSSKNRWQARALPCPSCHKPTKSLHRHQVIVFCLFIYVAAFFQKRTCTGCPSCIRGTIWKWNLINILPANLVWLCGLLPMTLWWTVTTFFQGHSPLVIEAHLPDLTPADRAPLAGTYAPLIAEILQKHKQNRPSSGES